MKENTVRTFKKQHQEANLSSKFVKAKKRGRPLLLGGLDKMIQTFLKNIRSHGGIVNTAVAIAVADALAEKHPEQELNHVQFRICTWTEVCSTAWAFSDVLGRQVSPSQVKFTCPILVNPLESLPEDTDSDSDSDWEEEDTHDDGNAFDVFID